MRLLPLLLAVPLIQCGLYRKEQYTEHRLQIVEPSTAPPEKITRDLKQWHCGIGPVSMGVAISLTQFSTRQGEINTCCMEHDDLLEVDGLSRAEVDRVFCECLGGIESAYVQYFVKPVFCAATRVHTLVFHSIH